MTIVTVVWNMFLGLLEISAIQAALATLLFWFLGWLVIKYPKLKQWRRWGAIAYLWVEDNEMFKGLKGAEKLKPFREKLTELCRAETSGELKPVMIGEATKEMEKLVIKEHKDRAKGIEQKTQDSL